MTLVLADDLDHSQDPGRQAPPHRHRDLVAAGIDLARQDPSRRIADRYLDVRAGAAGEHPQRAGTRVIDNRSDAAGRARSRLIGDRPAAE